MTLRAKPGARLRIDLSGPNEGFWVELLVVDRDQRALVERAVARGDLRSALATVAVRSNLVDDDGRRIDVTRSDDWRHVPLTVVAEMTARMNEHVAYWKRIMRRPSRG